ncbi:MAG: nucleotidyltransferase family protein [Aliarcobacter sp.]|nr:nucleotidyltransferase family protein [Aliarcobacter sp.]
MECLSLTYELNLDRNKRLLNQLKKVIIALNQIGIRPIIIKGAESLIQESSISNGRMMNDIDIWVLERNNWSEIQKALESISYKCEIDINTFDQEKEHHFPPFYNENEPARLELHHRLIRPSLKYLLSEEIIKNRIIYHKKNDLEYGTISDIDCIALSYIQSSHMSVPHFDTGMVPAMKWLDFIERFYNLKNKNKKYIHSRTEFSIIGTNEDIDNQLFTALKKYFDFPYEGKLNNKYIDQKELINNNPYKAEIG